jgi:hypothetical protein
VIPPAGKEVARDGKRPRAGHAVQLRFATELSSEEYVSERGWQKAILEKCPVHGRGGCSFARHTPYARKTPPGALIARWYCSEAHQTFSLLPDCFCSRLPGPLVDVDAAVRTYEAASTWEAAADQLQPDTGLQAVLRWLRRRVASVHAALHAVIGLHPDRFAGCSPTLAAFGAVLKVPCVLVALREIAAASLDRLPPPLGFGPRPARRWSRSTPLQQDSGPDPPAPHR